MLIYFYKTVTVIKCLHFIYLLFIAMALFYMKKSLIDLEPIVKKSIKINLFY